MKVFIYFFCCCILIYSGCTSSIPKNVYLPLKNEYTKSYFVNGIPFGIYSGDSIFFIASIDKTNIGGNDYVRLWILYTNMNYDDYLLEPLKFVKMKTAADSIYQDDISPESPTKILSDIEEQKLISNIYSAIGGSLKYLSADNTKIYDSENKKVLSIGDKENKQEDILDRTEAEIAYNSNVYNTYKNSITQGILKRNTLLKNQSINGYIYFPAKELKEKKLYTESVGSYATIKEKYVLIDQDKYIYTFKFITPNGTKTITFKPIAGE